MTSLNHSNNLCLVTLHFPSSTPPSTSAASSSSASSSGWTQKITKKIQELNKQLNDLNNLNERQSGYLPEQDSKSLDSLPTQLTSLETVQKLAEFAESLTKDPSNNILNNLCTGLETFLGFNSETKGYTGQGIVYSDLDRLCDGVMGFLSGVLDAVKDDEAVKTYDKSLLSDRLNDVISFLNNNIGNGAAKFEEALAVVSWWITRYHKELDERTGDVKNRFMEIREKHFTDGKGFQKALKELSNLGSASDLAKVNTLLEACFTELNELKKDFTLAEEAYSHLDPELKKKLNEPLSKVQQAVEKLVTAANNKELHNLLMLGEDIFKEVEWTVIKFVARTLNELSTNIHTKFEIEIKTPIKDVNSRLTSAKNALTTSIEKAELAVSNAMERVNEILKVLSGEENGTEPIKKKSRVDAAAKKLNDKADALRQNYEQAQKDVKAAVKKAEHAVTILESKVKEDLEAMKKSINESLDTLIINAGKYKTTFGVTKHALQTAIDKLYSDIDNLKELHKFNGIREGLDNSLPFLTAIKKHDALQPLTTYFNQLNDGIMGPLKNAMRSVGEGINRLSMGENDSNGAFSKDVLEAPLTLLLSVLEGEALDTTSLDELKRLLDISSVDELKTNLKSLGSSIQSIIRKLKSDPSLKYKVTKADINSLLTELGTIAQAVSGHSEKVVQIVMTAVEKKVKEEISIAAAAINNGVYECRSLIANDHDSVALTYVKVLQNGNGTFSGITKLFNDLGKHINQGLKDFKTKVDTDVFRRNGWDESIGIDQTLRNYKTHRDNNVINKWSPINEALPKLQVTTDGDNKYTGKPYSDGTIENEILGLHFDFTDAFTDFIAAVNQVVKKQGDVSLKNSVYNYLDDLGRIIGAEDGTAVQLTAEGLTGPDVNVQGITKIQKDIINILGDEHKANNTLTKILEDADNFYSGVMQAESNKAIDSITTLVTSRITDATRSIQRECRLQYYNKMSKMFEKIKIALQYGMMEISKTINDDIARGVKGLLKSMLKDDGKGVTSLQSKHGITALATKACTLLTKLVIYVAGDLKKVHPKFTQLHKFDKSVEHFTYELINHAHFSHSVSLRLSTLSSATSALDPQALPDAGRPVLRALKDGMMGFVKELGKAYISKYSMETFEGPLTEAAGELVTPYSGPDKVYKLTAAGRRVAKVFLTIFNILHDDLNKLNSKCYGPWRDKTICEMDGVDENPLGQFMKRCGYRVAQDKDSKEGELKLPMNDFKGENISEKVNATKFRKTEQIKHLKVCASNTHDGEAIETYEFDLFQLLDCLLTHVNDYNEVGHLSTLYAKRQPTTVYEMLIWLTGLTHTRVHAAMVGQTFLELLRDPVKEATESHNEEDVDEPIFLEVEPNSISLDAYPTNIQYGTLNETLMNICTKAYDILVCIAGTGDAGTIYGCDYSNNTFNLYYPQSGEDCFDMLLDILRRVLPQLKFLQMQCTYRSSNLGWRDCHYGKGISSGKSQCTEHSTNKATCQPNTKANGQPNCQVNTQANCRPTSPLMSYLNDCLPGHLPHNLSKIGCKYECVNCPSTSKKGMPCLTPLGFRRFSGSAKTGKDIFDVLNKFFKIGKLSTLFSLMPKPPTTLAEHFGLVLSMANGINGDKTMKDTIRTFAGTFDDSITGMSVKLYSDPSDLTTSLTNAYGNASSSHSKCEYNHLINLTTGEVCSDRAANIGCAPYLRSLCSDWYIYLPNKQAETYLSWAVYMPWTLWQYLKNLYDDFCDIFCQDWGCHTCLQGNKCKRGHHGHSDENTKKPHCQCTSMVRCRGVFPTLYKYGFHFGAPATLNSKSNPKTCTNFHDQLYQTLHSKYFADLFEKCDDFLWIIRQPFIWLNVALWSLSLFYLIHIMVVRLDLLHIKSHLHSPSSHRIAAQSLLAAARVNKLNRVFYLQP